MIRTTQHILKYQTDYKSKILDQIFQDYKQDLKYYIELICSGDMPLKKYLSTKDLPINIIRHSQGRRAIYKQASEIIRSQIKQASNKRYKRYQEIYAKCKEQNRHKSFTSKKFSELNLNNIIFTKYFTIPKMENVSISLYSELIDFKIGNSFDEFVRIKSPYFQDGRKRAISIKLPLKHHKHSNKYSDGNRKNTIQLKFINYNYYINLFGEKKSPQLKQEGSTLGIDQGYKKLLSCSNEQILGEELFDIYQKLIRKQRGSKAYKRLLKYKSNEINRICNLLDTSNIREIVLEDLKKVKHNTKQKKSMHSKTMNRMQYGSYRQVMTKLANLCEENGVLLTKVRPAYTSQTCSNCGCVDRNSRKGEYFNCQHCGYKIDADFNASINISRMGVYRPHSPISQIYDIRNWHLLTSANNYCLLAKQNSQSG